VNDINADCADISVSRQGSDIRVECASGLQSVIIYGTDGRTYRSYTDLNGTQSVTIATVPAQCYLIAVTPTSGTTKVIKLR
jgi:hypothetical protein